jgi:hypothetical protein
MILPQPPAFPIILCAQAVSAAYMAAKGFPPVAAIQADHPILADGLPHRYRRSQRHLGRIGASDLSQRSMYRSDEIGKLAGPDTVMPKVTSDNFRREMWIRALGIHGSPQI